MRKQHRRGPGGHPNHPHHRPHRHGGPRGHHHPGGGHGRRMGGPGRRRPRHNVPVNIEETANSFIARVYCVGFAKENVKINLIDNMIYISGSRQPENEFPDWLLQEFPIKSFERWFELSEHVDQEAITATFEDGILVITAPKTSAAQAPEREITIS
ncbi:Hsp20/alpha crystallin family protein [Neolewinella aurantiaca]|uniref:Hsp20/alpha crystallin family protein n=1 Tax=Neolewinella aurantiaca TaxID=2602767 RepID=A0A5C7FDN3_9BACT|nr:Hsp20/alpha crystallin family protein [Neolewinella aurantiaca]TXF89120.1 Hsp20/alpha crystallin family protein [Neolewinella aurantiaca]